MSIHVLVMLAVLAVVAVLLPLSRPRRWLLAASKWLVYLVVVAAVLTAALFALLPETTPVAVQPLADLTPACVESLAWPLLASLVLAIALPLLTVLDAAQRLARHADFLDKLAEAIEPNGALPGTPGTNGHDPRQVVDLLQRSAKATTPVSTRAPLKHFLG